MSQSAGWLKSGRDFRLVLFQVTASQVYRGFELIPFVFLGVIGGVFGHYFIRLNLIYAKFRAANFAGRPILEVIIVALITSLVSYLIVYARQVSVLCQSRETYRTITWNTITQNTYCPIGGKPLLRLLFGSLRSVRVSQGLLSTVEREPHL